MSKFQTDDAGPAEFDAVVVGGGPAGLEAALQLARSGASTALLEEGADLGGQYFKRRHGAVLQRHGDYRPAGSALIRQVRDAGVVCITERLVWGVDDDHRTLLTTGVGRSAGWSPVRGRAVIVATGAFERSFAFPGWQLPGVVTPGYALHLATCDGVSVGERVVVAGSGPFLLPVACAVSNVGARIVMIAELNRPYRPSLAAVGSAAYPSRLKELAGYVGQLRRQRIPLRQGWQVVRADGVDKVEQVTLRRLSDGRTEVIEADAVAVGYGFRPSTDLLQSLGATCTEDHATGDLIPVRDRFGRTSAAEVYVAGESAGVAGVHAARVRGRLAGIAAAEDLGLRPAPERFTRRQLRSSASLDRFAVLNARLFPIDRALTTPLPDETIVCRCEGVTAAAIRAAGQADWADLGATKSFTRAGMGPCQGRECQPSVRALCGPGATAPWTVRSPLKPLPMAAITAGSESGGDVS